MICSVKMKKQEKMEFRLIGEIKEQLIQLEINSDVQLVMPLPLQQLLKLLTLTVRLPTHSC